ncbi:sigma 54-interacting transcriptional regulator [Ideonella sp. DXS22W]|uniref:Sigma 54-interacting transcriptional regulator n=1 Tax=Pseudaquabacterium inlustre TaxID=2984192 RepID=A0ABU9CFR2_9BURK
MLSATGLPQDTAGLLKLAAQSMFDLYAQTVQGMMVVDREHRIVWISEGYKRFLPALGFTGEHEFVGQRIEAVVPNTLLGQVIETGRPIMVDLLTNHAGTFLVSRVPLRDAAGTVIGALGMVLMDHPESTMQPLMAKFVRIQHELESAQRELAAEQSRQRRSKYTIAAYIGASPAALEVKRQARRVAGTESTVLLLGETGTGKELLAHAIHAASARAAAPFVGVNIAAVPDSLLEAEFFGVAPGAYTGADRKGRDGKFKLADGGTLFLDEIGDMPLALQAKLLRALQEQEVEPLGSNRVHKVNVRVIAATSRDLGRMVADGRFRADLYYRLHVLPIRLPALRERMADLEPLADSLLDDIARRSGLAHRSLSADALDRLAAHAWPGNIRELRNVLEQAALMTDEPVLHRADIDRALGSAVGAVPQAAAGVAEPSITLAHAARAPAARPALPPAALTPERAPDPMPPRMSDHRREPAVEPGPDAAAAIVPLPQAIAALEARAIREALAATGGNKLAAARLLGIARATLYEKLAALAPDSALQDK